MSTDNVIDFEGQRTWRMVMARRACVICAWDRTPGGEERYGPDGLRWICDQCIEYVDALIEDNDPEGAA